MNRAVALLAFLLLCGCHVRPGPSTPPEPVDASLCDAAGRHLEELGCSIVRTPAGTPWAQVCRDYAARGHRMGAECVRDATSCETAAVCP